MNNSDSRKLTIHPYIGGTTRNLLKSVRANGGVDPRFKGSFYITLLGSVAMLPARLVENLLYKRKIEQTTIEKDPIFIIGHWRSGTTHLHNVLSQDSEHGYVTTLQAIFPTCCVVLEKCKPLKKLVSLALPEKRMMDNVRLGLDFPQEEEFALSCLTTHSHHCNHFPKTIRKSFDSYVLFNSDRESLSLWKRNYLSVLKKATFIAGGRRLVLKNPYNTARVKTLLEMFPDAKFVHIYRNPYNIYLSSLHDFIKEADEMALQEYSEEDFSELCFELYEKLMSEYWDSRHLIPEGNLCEIAYEDFDRDPHAALRTIYEKLNIESLEAASEQATQYLDSLGGYRKNRYSYSRRLMEEITKRWHFAIDRLEYSVPEDIAVKNDKAWTCQMDY